MKERWSLGHLYNPALPTRKPRSITFHANKLLLLNLALEHYSYAAFTPGYVLLDTSCIHLYPLVASTYFLYRRQNCRQFVARLLLDTKGYKSTVTSMNSIMSPRYSPQVFRTRNLYPSTYMYPNTSCSSGIHVSGRHVSWCKRGISALFVLSCFIDVFLCLVSYERIKWWCKMMMMMSAGLIILIS